MKIVFPLLIVLLFSAGGISAQTIFARQTGFWDEAGAWSLVSDIGPSCGCFPTAANDVVIDGWDVTIDAITGNVSANSVLVTNVSNFDSHLFLQNATLTVTNDFEIENVVANFDAELTIFGTGAELLVGGDFSTNHDNGDDIIIIVNGDGLLDVGGDINFDQSGGDETTFNVLTNAEISVAGNINVIQSGGDDTRINIDGNGIMNIAGDGIFTQNGGDDTEINVNRNSGIAGQFNIVGNATFNHNGGDDTRVLVDDASSVFSVGGDVNLNLNTGTNDDFLFNADNGEINITGDLNITRASDYGPVDFDLDGGDINVGNINVNSNGALFTLGSIRFFIDGDSELNCDNLDVTFNGADDFYIRINQNNGTAGKLNVANDFSLVRNNGDDIEIFLREDDSEFNVGGNVAITSNNGEDLDIELDNSASWTIGGDLDIIVSRAENVVMGLALNGGAPSIFVNNDFSWISQTGDVDCILSFNGGSFTTGNDFTLTNSTGADDFDLDLEGTAIVNVGNDFKAEITGGDDLRIDLGDGSVGSTARFVVNGNASFLLSDDSGPTPLWRLRLFDDTRFMVGENLILSTDFTSTALCLMDIQNTAEVDITGDVQMTAVGSGELEIRQSDDSFFRISGNFERQAAPNNFGTFNAAGGNGTVEFKGTTAQVIAEDAGAGGDLFFYQNVRVNNSFGTSPDLSMEGEATVHGELIMADGIVGSDLTNILVIADDATVSGASDQSHIDGYVRKMGDDQFTFPIGNGGFYGPLSISEPDEEDAAFESRYVWADPESDGFDVTMLDPVFDHVSRIEYWILNRSAETSEPEVTLSWNTPRSGGVVNEADLRIAQWNGTGWDNFGEGGLSGNPTSGTIANGTTITDFSISNPLTLASITAINPLPIELISFNAFLDMDKNVQLDWVTKSETNSDYFTLEKSKDGVNWSGFETVSAAGNSSVTKFYETLDRDPIAGLSYYRLKQTDFDGTFEYFGPVVIEVGASIAIYPNPASDQVTVTGEFDESAKIKLVNAQGQNIPIKMNKAQGMATFSIQELENGTYYLVYGKEAFRLVVLH